MEIKALVAQREESEKKIREIIRDREKQKLLMEEIINGTEDKHYRSEVDGDGIKEAQRQGELGN